MNARSTSLCGVDHGFERRVSSGHAFTSSSPRTELAFWPFPSVYFLIYPRPYKCGSFSFSSLGDDALLSVYFIAFQGKAQILTAHFLSCMIASVWVKLTPQKAKQVREIFSWFLRIWSHGVVTLLVFWDSLSSRSC